MAPYTKLSLVTQPVHYHDYLPFQHLWKDLVLKPYRKHFYLYFAVKMYYLVLRKKHCQFFRVIDEVIYYNRTHNRTQSDVFVVVLDGGQAFDRVHQCIVKRSHCKSEYIDVGLLFDNFTNSG